MSDASNFLGWLLEDIDSVSAEIGTPRQRQLQEFARQGFLRLRGTYSDTDDYEITSKWVAALASHVEKSPISAHGNSDD